jgi:hypothetical protein
VAKLVIGVALGIAVGVVIGAAVGIHAEQFPTDETIAAADEADVDALDLQGAVNTTGLEPRAYLVAVGELSPPWIPLPNLVSPGWPIGGALGQRIFCVEAIESSHGRFMFNPTPWYGEHAQGWLGWLPSTARRWGVVIGDRASEWAGAARMLQAGAGSQFYGVAVGRC